MPRLTVHLLDATTHASLALLQLDLPAVQDAGYASRRIIELFDRWLSADMVNRQLDAESNRTELLRVARGQAARVRLVVDRPNPAGPIIPDASLELKKRDACLVVVRNWLASHHCPPGTGLGATDYAEAFAKIDALHRQSVELERSANMSLAEVNRALAAAGAAQAPDGAPAQRLVAELDRRQREYSASLERAEELTAHLHQFERMVDQLQAQCEVQELTIREQSARIRELEDLQRGASRSETSVEAGGDGIPAAEQPPTVDRPVINRPGI